MVDVLRPSPLASAPIDLLGAPTFSSINSYTTDSQGTSVTDERGVRISIHGCKNGLGIKIVDGINILKSVCGIFVKEVLPGSLAEKDGQLHVGDQLLEVNGVNLIGVSREDCRKIMEGCTASNQLSLLVARDLRSREEFNRLSISLGNMPDQLYKSSEPYSHSGLTADPLADNYRLSTISALTNDTARKSRTSSTISTGSASLTQVSDISDDTRPNISSSNRSSFRDPASTTDVIVEIPSDTNINKPRQPLFSGIQGIQSGIPPYLHSSDDDSPPPPPPSTAPPPLDEMDTELIQPKKRLPTDAEVAMAGISSTIAALANKVPKLESAESESVGTVTIAKQSTLGITIRGGTNKPEGPHIYIDRVISGLDVANDGNLMPGDRLITVNGESMEGITKEHALRVLAQLKLKHNVKDYEITYGRKEKLPSMISSDKRLMAMMASPMTTSTAQAISPSTIGQPTTLYTSSMFDSPDGPTDDQMTSPTSVTRTNMSEVAPIPTSSGEVGWQRTSENEVEMRRKNLMIKQDSYKRLTVDPRKKITFNKLIMAMEYMGHKISETDQESMQQQLGIETGGKVAFQDFADLVKKMFEFKLDMSMMEPTFLMGGIERKDSMEFPPLRKNSSGRWTGSSDTSTQSAKEDSPRMSQDAELERMRQHLHEEGQRKEEERQKQASIATQTISKEDFLRMQTALREKEQYCSQLEMQVEYLTKEVVDLRNQNQLYLTQLDTAEKEAKKKQHQLEEKLRNERRLREERSELPSDVEELRKRLAVLDCELRKEQNTSRRYQVTTERLTQLSESVQEALAGSETGVILYHPRGTPAQRGDPVTGNPRPPHYLSKHSRHTNVTLGQEVKETLVAVKKLLDHQPLPHGWEETYTEDGLKFYINHQKQVTSWVNPLTRVSAGVNQGSRPSSRATSRASSHASITTPPQQ
ncbi:syntaxin-binding protein 4-like [Dysidea avara]|uniref:syntaxin-binding protein 4-like n=1 Tax=Dysidea avara TaxID=196820 RepID=UPI00331B3F82